MKSRPQATLLAAVAASALASPGAGVTAHRQGLTITRYRLQGAPVAITTAAGSIWAVTETSDMRAELIRLDPHSGKRLARFSIGPTGPDFGALTAGAGFVWAVAGSNVIRVDATGRVPVARANVPGEAVAVALEGPGAWVAGIGPQHDTVTGLDSSTLADKGAIRITVQPVSLAAGLGAIWLASTGGLWRIDPSLRRLIPSPTPAAMPAGLAVAGERLWLIERIRVAVAVAPDGRIATRIALPFSPGAIAATPRRLWVTDNCGCRTGRLALIDARTHRVLAEAPIGETPVGVAVDGSGAWVATFGDRTISHVRATP